ncbi:FtsW/RodA/SpoVE family cell cycle protein, partial [bacterium]|nr:FtsW/RodA/SpoVE family cell cycle protein [bacterium]
MSLQKKRYIENFNWLLISIVGALLFIGVLNLYSALYIWGEEGLTHLFISQVVWLGLGMLALIGILFIDYRIFDRISYPLYWIMVGLLVLTLLIGKEVAGHKSWIGFGGFAVQPSEFAKLTYILVAAKFFSDNPNPDGYKLFELWRPAILMLIPFGLVVLQGDLGSG